MIDLEPRTAELVRERLGFDAEALRAKYRAEREKRVQRRPEGTAQYVPTTDRFADYARDPYVGPTESREPVREDVDVVVVGGGLTGVTTGSQLKMAGVEDVRIIEQGGDFGGAWYWNRYPGLRCDTEALIYLPLLEATGYMPTEKYTRGVEIREYCQLMAKQFDLYDGALFRTKVSSISWHEDLSRYIVRTDNGDELHARFLCLGSGGLNYPKLPGIPGIENFQGRVFHTSRWDYAYTGGDTYGGLTGLADKNVAIIGTGATAVQCIPRIVEHAKSLTVFQRTPTTVDIRHNQSTDPAWFSSLPEGWQRARIDNWARLVQGVAEELDMVGDRWTHMYHLTSELREQFPELNRAELGKVANFVKMEAVRQRVADTVQDPDTAAALMPWYDWFCKRPTFSDEFLPAFNNPNVSLIDTNGRGVERITEHEVWVDDVAYPVDLLIFATGFEFGAPPHEAGRFELTGRDGADVPTLWRSGMTTLHGLMTRGMPNLFMLGGISQGQITANFTHVMTAQADHTAKVISRCLQEGVTSIDVREDAQQQWVDRIVETAVDRSEFHRECTPSYLSFEGDVDKRAGINSPYGAGPLAYIEVLREAREQDLNQHFEVGRAAAFVDADTPNSTSPRPTSTNVSGDSTTAN